jgi:predicted enzyme related to lactoylglutathione lyase
VGSRIANITIDTNDVPGATAFWQAATGYEIAGSDDGYAFLSDPDKGAPSLFIQGVPEPRVGKNRVHIDFATPDIDAESARLTALGATQVQRHNEGGNEWIVMSDTDGNVFCVVERAGD